MGQPDPSLSKSRYLAGLQCTKRAYLEEHHPELAAPLDEAERAIIEGGLDVGRLAEALIPGAVRIPVEHLSHEDAADRTWALMDDERIPAIYEAAFLWDDMPVRVDCLARTGDGRWDLLEVKASTDVKPEHVADVAFQRHVLESLGVPLRHSTVLHANPHYVREGEIDPHAFFATGDVGEQVEQHLPNLLVQIERFKNVLRADTAPEVPVGSHCKKPQTCPFYDHCNQTRTLHPVHELPFLSQRAKSYLAALEITDIREIPEDIDTQVRAALLTTDPSTKFKKDWAALSDNQKLIARVVRTGEPYHNEAGLAGAFAQLQHPIQFLDFETVQPALPLWSGTGPYATVPVQWSNHTLTADGRVYHQEFLHADVSDPRIRFLTSLTKAIDTKGSILVYSSFEEKRLQELAAQFPDYAPQVEAITAKFVDLLKILREHVYYPEFHGSHSLKAVLPVLVPGLSYDDLDIKNGAVAAAAFLEILKPETTPERRAELSMQLLAYCRRDTEAMLKLFLRLAPQHQLRQSAAPARRAPRARSSR